jgi:hypothetical protein
MSRLNAAHGWPVFKTEIHEFVLSLLVVYVLYVYDGSCGL